MAHTRPPRAPDSHAVARPRPRTIPKTFKPVKVPRVKHITQVSAHKMPVRTVQVATPKKGRLAGAKFDRIVVTMPKITHVAAHAMPVRTVKTTARKNRPSVPVIVGVTMPKVTKVAQHAIPDTI